MGVRSALVGGFSRAAKAFGGQQQPEAMAEAAEQVSQMGPDHPFSPGEPVAPYDGYSRTPRQFDYQTSYNVATRPRTHERVSFDTLRGLIESYDVAQICIHHRIDSLRSLDWKLIADDSFNGDVQDAVAIGMAALRRPDRVNSFETWFAKWMYDVLAYDAGTLYRLRNRAGRCVGLAPVDGSSIAPLLDYWGNSPAAPAEAYVQYANGVPWNWLTRDDLVYEPFRPRNNSPYGHAPLESVILNANTDIRFQVYFLQRFTEGNIPEAFASAPETWSPDQIEQWQGLWDSAMYGDQSRKSQIRWMPGGSTIAWSNEKDFTDAFSLFLMRKSCAAYHVVPTDIGFTESSNYSTGESQADVGHRIGDLPLGRYTERILTNFLKDDLGLPLQFAFDWGEEQDDRVAQANADDVYAKLGVVGVSELREMRFGLTEPQGQQVPRFVYTTRAGPIPLSALLDVAGPIDPATAAPVPGTVLPHKEFELVEGVVPVPPPPAPALAERLYGPSAIPPALPAPPPGTLLPDGQQAVAAPVAKEATAGITSGTGIVGYDGPGDDDDDDRAEVAKSELAAFRRFERARRKAGTWRDFTFDAVAPVQAHRLNNAGRLTVRKAAGEVAVAGLAVQAEDTGRVLMLQRALDPDDPVGGTWEFPGGHIEGTETPLQGAWREWAEETGCIPPPGQQGGMWASPDGVYQGIVWTVPSESDVPVRCGALVANPDDPDGDAAEAIAWWDPAALPGNPVVRPELLADIDAVMAALGCGPNDTGCCGAECCAGGCCQGASGCPCGSAADVAKAVSADPKVQAWPGWKLDGPAVAYWAPLITAAVAAELTKAQINQMAAAYLAEHADQQGDAPGKGNRNDAAAAWLLAWLAAAGITFNLSAVAAGIITDAWLIGAAAAAAVLAGEESTDTGGWQPGQTDTAQQRIEALGLGAALGAVAAMLAVKAAEAITGAYTGALSRILAGADADTKAPDLAAELSGAVKDPATAERPVQDQITGNAGTAKLEYCGAQAVEYGSWATDPSSNTCPICQANEDAGRVPLGEPYPSGDTVEPAHPGCRCAVIPESPRYGAMP